MTTNPWEHAARAFEPAPPPRFPTPGALAHHITPATINTPALNLVDRALTDAWNTPDARLIISMAPQEGKSVRVAKDFPLWALLQNPDLRIVVASYAQRLADRNGRTIRNTITAHPDLGLRVARDNGSVSEWTLDGHEGGVYSVGIGGALTGRPADLLIIDDPIKDRREADSKVFRDNNWDWWTDTASARLAPGAPTILILTRWHHDDLAGRLLKSDTGWNLLNIPAQCEDPTTDPLGRQHGEYMASARKRTPAQWEQRKKAAGPTTWASLYQGNPTPTVGNIFPRTSWATYDTPLWVTQPNGTHLIPNVNLDTELIQSWDLAFKDTATSDYVVGQVWLRRGADVHLLDQVRGRWSFTETVTQVRQLAAKWPQAVAKLVEDKANGPAVIDALHRTVHGLIPVNPEGGKQARAQAVSPLVEARNVHLPAPELAPWVGDLIEEAAMFPNGTHDDQVDALTQALTRLMVRIVTNPRATTGVVGLD